MSGDLPYERILQECLTGELKVLNAHLPARQKNLAALLEEEYPHISCNDGSVHLFKKRELEYLAGLTNKGEQELLMLPILIQIDTGRSETHVLCPGDAEKKVVQSVLDMPLGFQGGAVRIYRPQLTVLRKRLKTTTQYLYSPHL